ncbi:MAG: hypothetical protein IEMM0008_1518 [bacterium]|nr:MAG: hypothetical protein IEMM0008_1518 [bacterium]
MSSKYVFILVLLFGITLTRCITDDFPDGFFPNTDRITVTSNTSASLQWETSHRDAEAIIVATTLPISLSGGQIDTTSFAPANTMYWRLSFGTGSNGSVSPANSEMSNDINSFVASVVGGTINWIVYTYDQNGNLIRSSLVHTYP